MVDIFVQCPLVLQPIHFLVAGKRRIGDVTSCCVTPNWGVVTLDEKYVSWLH